jgi:IclR family pca regulon transcriptional regulator
VRFIVQIKRRRAMSVAFRVGDALPAERCAPGALFAQDWGEEEFAQWQRRLERDPDYDTFPALPTHQAKQGAVEGFAQRIEAARTDGYADDDQLIEQGLIAIAVPVHDRDGAAVCALSVVSHTTRQTVASLREAALDAMRETAARMTARLAEAVEAGETAETEPPAASAAVELAPAAAAAPASAPPPATPSAAPPAAPSAASRPLSSAASLSLSAKEQLGSEYLQSLARGISVLSALGAGPQGLTLSEAAAATGLPRATARRSLLTSVRQGYVATEGHRFRILPRVLELGYARLGQLSLGELAQPHLAAVVRTVHESASMAVLDGQDIRYVARAAAERIMSVDIMIGTRFPAYATSMGRVLLADRPRPERERFLADTRLKALTDYTITDDAALLRVLDGVARDGYALVDQELEEGLRSIAVPVRDPAGFAVAAVNVSMHAARTSPDQARTVVLPLLRAAAAALSTDLALVSGPTAAARRG